jgi:hypothetical protein
MLTIAQSPIAACYRTSRFHGISTEAVDGYELHERGEHVSFIMSALGLLGMIPFFPGAAFSDIE